MAIIDAPRLPIHRLAHGLQAQRLTLVHGWRRRVLNGGLWETRKITQHLISTQQKIYEFGQELSPGKTEPAGFFGNLLNPNPTTTAANLGSDLVRPGQLPAGSQIGLARGASQARNLVG
jgi:hypothetical protein